MLVECLTSGHCRVRAFYPSTGTGRVNGASNWCRGWVPAALEGARCGSLSKPLSLFHKIQNFDPSPCVCVCVFLVFNFCFLLDFVFFSILHLRRPSRSFSLMLMKYIERYKFFNIFSLLRYNSFLEFFFILNKR